MAALTTIHFNSFLSGFSCCSFRIRFPCTPLTPLIFNWCRLCWLTIWWLSCVPCSRCGQRHSNQDVFNYGNFRNSNMGSFPSQSLASSHYERWILWLIAIAIAGGCVSLNKWTRHNINSWHEFSIGWLIYHFHEYCFSCEINYNTKIVMNGKVNRSKSLRRKKSININKIYFQNYNLREIIYDIFMCVKKKIFFVFPTFFVFS